MTDRFYGTDREVDIEPGVTKDTSTTSKVIELRVEDGEGITKKDLQRALARIAKSIAEDTGRSEA